MSTDIEKELQQQLREANRHAQPLNIIGGASKSFYGRTNEHNSGVALHTAAHHGVLHYDPADLVVTVRAGTCVIDLEELLAAKNQALGFEPPKFTEATTIGGAVASGLAGPSRPYAGTVRDFVLGVKLLTGTGEVMKFGGEVMKNVAGFDLSRLMAGAMGTLGVLLDLSLRVIPQSQKELTLLLEHPNPDTAIALFNRLAARPLPLSAAAWHNGETRIRLSASAAGIKGATKIIGGEVDTRGAEFWQQLRDHQLPFFADQPQLLRVSVPPGTEMIPLPEAVQLVDWGGAQRWISGEVSVDSLRKVIAEHGGHVTHFRQGERGDHGDRGDIHPSEVFQPMSPVLQTLHLRLKRAFDPAGILNPGRLYADF